MRVLICVPSCLTHRLSLPRHHARDVHHGPLKVRRRQPTTTTCQQEDTSKRNRDPIQRKSSPMWAAVISSCKRRQTGCPTLHSYDAGGIRKSLLRKSDLQISQASFHGCDGSTIWDHQFGKTSAKLLDKRTRCARRFPRGKQPSRIEHCTRMRQLSHIETSRRSPREPGVTPPCLKLLG